MAQYDLLLTQNVHSTGVEFAEKYVNLAKGTLLSGAADGTPTVLSPGTNGYQLVRDDASPTGLKWQAIAVGHTQGTDTGTTQQKFIVASASNKIELTAESASKFGVKVSGGATYADFQAKIGTFDKVVVSNAPATDTELANKAYVDSRLAANDAMVFKGTVGASGTMEIAAFNAMVAYEAGWAYKIVSAGTVKGIVCDSEDIGNMIISTVDRASGGVDADWVMLQTNSEGQIIGPASSSDSYVALFSGTTGKLLKQGSGPLGSAAYANTGDFATAAQGTLAANAIPKSTITGANQIVIGTGASAPSVLQLSASTFVGQKNTGGVSAMTAAEARAVLNVADGANNYTHPANHPPSIISQDTSNRFVTDAEKATWNSKEAGGAAVAAISAHLTAFQHSDIAHSNRAALDNVSGINTGDLVGETAWTAVPASRTSTGVKGQIAMDANFIYVCTATNTWKRSAIATIW